MADRARRNAPEGTTIATAPPREALVVEADEKRLEGAGEHLVSNAIEALVSGRGTVVVRAAREPAHATIDVEDDGRGLPEPRDMLFDAYFTTKPKSVGLGLAIAQRTALDHGGSLEVKNVPGRTVFSVRIPLFSRSAQ